MNLNYDFKLQKKKWENLPSSLRMYGEIEPPLMQLEKLWEVVDGNSGEKLTEPEPDFAEFSSSDRMYPSMMTPEVKARWDLKNREWEQRKERFQWIKRRAHARFMFENPDMKLAQDLAETDYGRELIVEFGQQQQEPIQRQYSTFQQTQQLKPQVEVDADLYDEIARDGVDYDTDENVRVIPFFMPDAEKPYSIFATARDENGRIVEKLLAFDPNDHQVQYEYDAGGRLSRVWKDQRIIEHYQYGKHGERLTSETFNIGVRRFVYGEGLRLVQAGEVKYSYDPQGRLIMKQDHGQVTRYEYLSSGQLYQVHLHDGRRIEYVIDPLDRRVAKSINGRVVQKYLWHDLTTLTAVTDGDGLNMKEFAYNEEGDPVAMRCNGEVYHFASDQVGTIYMVASNKGDEVKRIICDSFGNTLVDTNERMNIPLGFAAGLYDQDTGLIHFGHREYDPFIGRFIQPDPIGLAGGDVDVYGYCADDPVNFVDRVGLKKSEEGEESENKEDDDITDSGFHVDQNKQIKKHNDNPPIKWGGKGRSLKDGPKYGKWGGGNYSGGVDGGKVGSASPVDSSDEAYKKHDLAYERIKNTDRLGDVNEEQKKLIKKADEELVDDLEKLDDDPSKWPNPPRKGTEGAAGQYRDNAITLFKITNYAR